MVHTAPGILQPTVTQVFQVLTYDLSWKIRRLPKDMVLAHETATPPFMVRLDAVENFSVAKLENTDSTIATFDYKQEENQKT